MTWIVSIQSVQNAAVLFLFRFSRSRYSGNNKRESENITGGVLISALCAASAENGCREDEKKTSYRH